MVKQTIQIFGRVKPTKAKTGGYQLESLDDGSDLLSFFVPKDVSDGLVNNKKEQHKFKFEKVFNQDAKQEDIFALVAKPVINNVISGYNGTIFAYGQTGSGKTFTITGGAEKYTQRGIIPRTLSYIFEQYDKMSDREFSTHVSYLELYNESGYDLLDPKHDASKLEDLPKVTLLEDDTQNVHLKNLSVHPAANEEDALNLLFLGDTNRMIAETPMNQASTRSHCIFTIHLMSKEVGSATVRRSKLHLVDLAGSERVSKTGVNGVLLTEAKYINLSLHYLEQVIVALSEKSRSHIPYRNSMMTSVLRDSLGGNCMTTMIATCSVEKKNIDESISTCRFAQRVAMIKNDAMLNEEMDPRLMVERLKQEIALLKEELRIATGGQPTGILTEEEIQRCQEAVDQYLNDDNSDAILNVGTDMRKLQRCYLIMKERIRSQPSTASSQLTEQSSDETHYDKMELKRLQDVLLQRDNEINILVNMLKKEKRKSKSNGSYEQKNTVQESGRRSARYSSSNRNVALSNIHTNDSSHSLASVESTSHSVRTPDHQSEYVSDKRALKSERRHKQAVGTSQILGDMSAGRQQAFEIFKQEYKERVNIERSKEDLKSHYAEAKILGAQVNDLRKNINQTKHRLEQLRVQRSLSGDSASDDEIELREELESLKSQYKEGFANLKVLKAEIEHLQHYLERCKVQLMKDFELWWAEQSTSAENIHSTVDVKSAWRTPPPSGGSTNQRLSPPTSSRRVPPLHGINGQTFIKTPTTQPTRSHHSRSQHSSHSSRKHDQTREHNSNPSTGRHNSTPVTGENNSDIQLTGDAEADADIMAFLKARQNAISLAQARR